jgi:hypothetical protein
VDSAINLAERVRDVGVQVVVAAQSVEGLGDHRQAPRLLASCAGGIVVQQCPDPERLLALAGQERVLEHNWELDYYGPRGFAKARMGERPRINPEQVRQAQPGEAWAIQAGQSIHLRVLPPPAVAATPIELTATLPLADDTLPLPAVEEPAPGWDRRRRCPHPPDGASDRPAGRSPSGTHRTPALTGPPALAARAAPAGTGSAMTSGASSSSRGAPPRGGANGTRRRGPTTQPPIASRLWLGGGRSWPRPVRRQLDICPPRWPRAGTGLACGAARGNPAPAPGPAGCLPGGLPPGRRPRQDIPCRFGVKRLLRRCGVTTRLLRCRECGS